MRSVLRSLAATIVNPKIVTDLNTVKLKGTINSDINIKGEKTITYNYTPNWDTNNYCFTMVNTILFSCYDPSELNRSTLCFVQEERLKRIDRSDLTRDDLFITLPPGKPFPLPNSFDILEEMTEKTLKPKGSYRTRDIDCMNNYLMANVEAGLPILPKTDLRKAMVGGVPLIQHIFIETDRFNTDWMYPSRAHIAQLESFASIDDESASKVECMEITFNKSTPREVELFSKWVFANHKEDQDRFPSGLISLDVEEIKIPWRKFYKLQQKVANWTEGADDIRYVQPAFKNGNCTNIPAKIIFGNGITWMASIKFNWSFTFYKNELGGTLDTKPIERDSPILKLLLNLGVYTGQGITRDRNGLQDFIKKIYGFEPPMPRVVELDALSHAAGYRLSNSSMYANNVIVMGGILNKEASCADFQWAINLEVLDKPFLCYLIGDVRMGYCNSTVLLTVLMRNLFPDPHVLCSTLQLTQKAAVSWFGHLTIACLNELEVDSLTKANATTRIDLMDSLKPRHKDGSINRESRHETLLFARLIPDWPTPIHGGPRHLHHVTAFFVSQYQILQEIHMSCKLFAQNSTANLYKSIDEAFIRKVTFARGLDRSPVLEPVLGPGFLVDIDIPYFNLDLFDISDTAIKEAQQRSGRPRELGILEKMRISPILRNRIFPVLRTVNLHDPKYSFWMTRITLYNDIKNLLGILQDKDEPGVPVLQQQVYKKFQNVLFQEEETRKKDEVIVENRKKREKILRIQMENANSGIHKRTAFQQAAYGIVPGDKTLKNRRRRQKKAARDAILKALPDYVGKGEWKNRKAEGKSLSRANFYNCKKQGHDLRSALIEFRQKAEVREALKGAPTICDAEPDITIDRDVILMDEIEEPQPSTSNHPPKFKESRTIKVIELNDSTDSVPMNNPEDNNAAKIEIDWEIEDLDPYQARFIDPVNPFTVDRYVDGDIPEKKPKKKKKKGKGKGKNSKAQFELTPERHNSESDQDNYYMYNGVKYRHS